MNYQATATFPQPFESLKGAIVVKQWFQIRLLRLEIKDQFFKGQSPVLNSPFGSKILKPSWQSVCAMITRGMISKRDKNKDVRHDPQARFLPNYDVLRALAVANARCHMEFVCFMRFFF